MTTEELGKKREFGELLESLKNREFPAEKLDDAWASPERVGSLRAGVDEGAWWQFTQDQALIVKLVLALSEVRNLIDGECECDVPNGEQCKFCRLEKLILSILEGHV